MFLPKSFVNFPQRATHISVEFIIVINQGSDNPGNLHELGGKVDIRLSRVLLIFNNRQNEKYISSMVGGQAFEVTRCSDASKVQNLIKAIKFDAIICEVNSFSSQLDDFLNSLSALGQSKPYLIFSIDRLNGEAVCDIIKNGVDDFIFNDSREEEIFPRLKLMELKLKRDKFLKQSLIKIRRDRKRYESLFLESPEAILVLQNRQGKVIGINRSVKTILGYDGKSLLGKYMSLIFPQIFGKDGYASNGEVISGSTVLQSIPYRRPDGTLISLDIMMSAIPWDSGYALMMLCRDVRSRHVKEDSLILESKKKALESFASGISDEFGDLLTSIEGNLSIMETKSLESLDLNDAVKSAKSACDRAREIVLEVSALRGRGRSKPKIRVSLPQLIRNTFNFSLFEFDRIKATINVKPNIYEVEGDEEKLRSMFEALIKNAAESVSSSRKNDGEIVIEVKSKEILRDNEYSIQPGTYVQVSFTDNGPGLKREDVNRIFDPYYSGEKKGRGFGLSGAAAVCRSHDGYISVNSHEGYGACFDVFLPALTSGPRLTEVDSNSLRVLVLDDEPHICAIVEKSLRMEGHDVYCASTGKAAIRAFEKADDFGRPFDVLILDLDIRGGMGGNETLARIRSMKSNVKAIVTTGYVDDNVLENYLEYGFSGVLTKPFRISKLISTVQRLGNKNSAN